MSAGSAGGRRDGAELEWRGRPSRAPSGTARSRRGLPNRPPQAGRGAPARAHLVRRRGAPNRPPQARRAGLGWASRRRAWPRMPRPRHGHCLRCCPACKWRLSGRRRLPSKEIWDMLAPGRAAPRFVAYRPGNTGPGGQMQAVCAHGGGRHRLAASQCLCNARPGAATRAASSALGTSVKRPMCGACTAKAFRRDCWNKGPASRGGGGDAPKDLQSGLCRRNAGARGPRLPGTARAAALRAPVGR